MTIYIKKDDRGLFPIIKTLISQDEIFTSLENILIYQNLQDIQLIFLTNRKINDTGKAYVFEYVRPFLEQRAYTLNTEEFLNTFYYYLAMFLRQDLAKLNTLATDTVKDRFKDNDKWHKYDHTIDNDKDQTITHEMDKDARLYDYPQYKSSQPLILDNQAITSQQTENKKDLDKLNHSISDVKDMAESWGANNYNIVDKAVKLKQIFTIDFLNFYRTHLFLILQFWQQGDRGYD